MCGEAPTSVPDLSLNCLVLDVQASSGELHPDGALRLKVELIARETGQQVGLAHTRIADQYHCGGI